MGPPSIEIFGKSTVSLQLSGTACTEGPVATLVETPSGTWKAVIHKAGWSDLSHQAQCRHWARRAEDEMMRGACVQRSAAERMTLEAALQIGKSPPSVAASPCRCSNTTTHPRCGKFGRQTGSSWQATPPDTANGLQTSGFATCQHAWGSLPEDPASCFVATLYPAVPRHSSRAWRPLPKSQDRNERISGLISRMTFKST